MTRRFVVSGTDTGIGKTVFSAALTGGLDGCYWKPVQCGIAPEADAATVARLSGLPAERILPERYRLAAPLAPHRAAELEGVTLDVNALVPPETDRTLVIEGAGGLMVPMTRSVLQIDLYQAWGAPVILVARTTLGTINHCLLSVTALKARGIPIHGLAFVGEDNADSERTIADFAGVRRLGRLPYLSPLNGPALREAFCANFSAEDFA